jgi:hypothetical protein
MNRSQPPVLVDSAGAHWRRNPSDSGHERLPGGPRSPPLTYSMASDKARPTHAAPAVQGPEVALGWLPWVVGSAGQRVAPADPRCGRAVEARSLVG